MDAISKRERQCGIEEKDRQIGIYIDRKSDWERERNRHRGWGSERERVWEIDKIKSTLNEFAAGKLITK